VAELGAPGTQSRCGRDFPLFLFSQALLGVREDAAEIFDLKL
jgi:hypothetical protein